MITFTLTQKQLDDSIIDVDHSDKIENLLCHLKDIPWYIIYNEYRIKKYLNEVHVASLKERRLAEMSLIHNDDSLTNINERINHWIRKRDARISIMLGEFNNIVKDN